MNAFINSLGVLTAWGYMEENGTDTAVSVDESFDLKPGAWKWDGLKWVAYEAPLTWPAYQAQARAALDASDITLLRCVENGIPVPSEWSSYRKSMRAIVSAQSGDTSQPMPARPSYPPGT